MVQYQQMVGISVIIPVYNAAMTIGRTLDCVLAQTLREMEIVCVDDGSTDDSAAILAERAKTDDRIVVVSQPNAGAAMARNRALEMARGKYIAFMDADDLYPANDVLEHLYTIAEEKGAKICGGGMVLRNPDGHDRTRFTGDEAWMNGFDKCGFVAAKDYPFDCGYTRFIYDRSLFADVKVRFSAYRQYEDPPFFARALAAAGSLYGVDSPTYVYCASPRQGKRSIEGNVLNARDFVRGLTEVLSLAAAHGLDALYRRTWAFCCSAPFRTSLGRWPYADAETFRLLCRLDATGPSDGQGLPMLDEMRRAAFGSMSLVGALPWCLKFNLRRAKALVGRHIPDSLKFWRVIPDE